MMRYLILIATAGFLSACAQMPQQDVAASLRSMEAYQWQLDDARNATDSRVDGLFVLSEKPVTLGFKEKRMVVGNTCNNHIGSLRTTEDNQILVSGMLASTLRACLDQTLEKRDALFFSLLKPNTRIDFVAGDPPKLIMTTPVAPGVEAYRLIFKGIPTPETRYQSEGEILFLEVAPATKLCSHPLIPNHQCLQVREIRFDVNGIRVGEQGEWQNFYNSIEGYTHQAGIRNVLRVKRFKLAQPPADGGSFAYVLDLTVESEVVKP